MKKFLMKVLFRLYPDGSEMLDETTVQKAYDHLIAAANKDMRDWLYLHEEDILMHADETLLDAIQNNPSPVITQFVGLRLSYDASYAINGYDLYDEADMSDDLFVGLTNAVARETTSDFTLGLLNKDFIRSFATDMRNNALQKASAILEGTGLSGKELTVQAITACDKKQSTNLVAVINITKNKPAPDLENAFIPSTEDCFVSGPMLKNWPDKEAMEDILCYPEDYAIVSVCFQADER